MAKNAKHDVSNQISGWKKEISISTAVNKIVKYFEVDTHNQNGVRISPMIWGPTGIGKSQIPKLAAKELDKRYLRKLYDERTSEFSTLSYDEFIKTVPEDKYPVTKIHDIRLSTLTPIDVRGIPYVDPNNLDFFSFIPPYFFPRNENERLILFLDEIPTAMPMNQVVAYQITLDRQMGDRPFSNNVRVILAGNRVDDGGEYYEMAPALKNRLTHIYVEPNAEDFINYSFDFIDPSIIGFLRNNPQYIHVNNMTDKVSENDSIEAFPTPRKWLEVNSVYKHNTSDFDRIDCLGLLGEVAGSMFYTFIQNADKLPDVEKIIRSENQVLPTYEKFEGNISVGWYYVSCLISVYMDSLKQSESKNDNKFTLYGKNFYNALEHLVHNLNPTGRELGSFALQLLTGDSGLKLDSAMQNHILYATKVLSATGFTPKKS